MIIRYLKIFFVWSFIILPWKSPAQDWLWAKTATNQWEAKSNSIATDDEGNSYITGFFSGTSMFIDNFQLSSHDLSRSYVFVAKYDSSGNAIWANCGGAPSGANADNATGITLDKNGNCYVTGYFQDTLIYGTDTLTTNHFWDIFIAKFDTSGSLIWLRKGGGIGSDHSNAIAVDKSGNCYVTGFFEYNFIIGEDTLTSNGFNDIFIAKLDSSGNEIWVRHAGGSNNDESSGISIDGNNNLYVTGYFAFTIGFGNDTLVSSGNTDVFLIKYDSSGNELWARKCGGYGSDKGTAISVDSSGNCYFTGDASDSSIFGNDILYGYGIFISKFNANGIELWTRQQAVKLNNQNNSFCISADNSGHIYLSGKYRDTLIFANDTLFTSAHSIDLFATKFDSTGNLIWLRNASDGASGWGISFDKYGSCYVSGVIVSSADFGNIHVYCQNSDLFIAKLSCGGTPPMISRPRRGSARRPAACR